MRKLKLTLGMVAIAFLTLTVMSCKDNKKEQSSTHKNHSEMNADMNHSKMNHDNHDGAHNDEKKDMDHSKMNHDNHDGHHKGDKKDMAMSGDGSSQAVLNGYFNLKDALVADDNAKAKELGGELATTIKNLNVASNLSDTQKADLDDIIKDAVEHAEHIAKSDITHQREHFKTLSKDVIDMVAITGTKNTLYQQFCPMYDGGTAWLSKSKDIRNPYYGSRMLKCGKVEKEIN
ncbi:DUF3347 domain-containing protein [Pontimicrobium sp. MEBiC06410]